MNTWEEYDKLSSEVAKKLEELTNNLQCGHYLNDVAESMTMVHHTLRQDFMDGFILKFVGLMAKNYREQRYDKRDEWAAQICNSMWEMCKEQYGYKENAFGDPIV